MPINGKGGITMNLKTGCLIASALLLQAPLFAAPRACPAPAPPTQESMTWNFPHEGARLLKDMNREAYDARMQASKLEVQARQPQVDWEQHAVELTAVRDDVNRMGQTLCRLESIRGQLPADEQSTVDKTARLTKEMAIFTQDAITYLNGNRSRLWSPSYRTYVTNLYNEAKGVNHAVSHSRES
jgi:hypothetical protein